MEESLSLINKSQIISVINKMLLYVDPRLVSHGERVAYIAVEILKHSDKALNIEKDKLVILSVMHDIGAYKTEEIDEMVSFDSKAVWSHAIYGYLFLKYMSPIGEAAEAILYHHLDYENYDKTDSKYLDYAALIYLADRIDILVATSESCNFEAILKNRGTRFKPEYVDLFFKSNPDNIQRKLRDNSYKEKSTKIIKNLSITKKEAFEYLKMMAFSVDLRSEYTVSHTINTTAISTEIGIRMNLPKEELKKLYLGALIHDVGKVAISPEILEFQGRLTPEQMEIMKQHVIYTHKIVEGLVDEEIVKIASCHHEKLDGSGYPNGLVESELTEPEKIIAVADIASALTSKRSYKEAYPKQKTLDILLEMKNSGKLCPIACDIIINNFDEIMTATDISRNPIIKSYNAMHKEYFMLNDKVQKLLKESEC